MSYSALTAAKDFVSITQQQLSTELTSCLGTQGPALS